MSGLIEIDIVASKPAPGLIEGKAAHVADAEGLICPLMKVMLGAGRTRDHRQAHRRGLKTMTTPKKLYIVPTDRWYIERTVWLIAGIVLLLGTALALVVDPLHTYRTGHGPRDVSDALGDDPPSLYFQLCDTDRPQMLEMRPGHRVACHYAAEIASGQLQPREVTADVV